MSPAYPVGAGVVSLFVGDVYCPRCLRGTLAMRIEGPSSIPLWECSRCGEFRHPFEAGEDGRFLWAWSDRYPKPNPGCPLCDSCNISTYGQYDEQNAYWECRRCNQHWIGRWYRFSDDRPDRWTIRVPVREVPWVSGTSAGKGPIYPNRSPLIDLEDDADDESGTQCDCSRCR